MPKVSIIIPVYNVEDYLEKALSSACNQTLKDIEIICIDDCSTDSSLKILEDFAQKDSRIKIIQLKENYNQGYARNIGISEAQGEYLMFLDSDDWLAENACEKAYKHINSCNVDIVSFNNYIYFEKENKYKIKDYENKPIFSIGLIWRYIYNTNFVKNNNIQFGNMHYCEDNVFYIKSLMLSKKMSFIKEPLYYYRKRANASSTTDSGKYYFEAIKAKNECYKIAKSYPENPFYINGLVYSINTILSIYKTFSKKLKEHNTKIDCHNKTRELLTQIFKELELSEELKKRIKTHDCKKIIKYNYEQYQIINFFERIFSIYSQAYKLHINFLGIRIKIKKILNKQTC